MADRDTFGGDVPCRIEHELGAIAPRIPRQRAIPPLLFISDDEAAEGGRTGEAMNYEEEKALERQLAEGKEAVGDANRKLSWGHAQNYWDEGDRFGAITSLERAGYSDDMVPFCREQGLSRDEADDLVREALNSTDRL